MSQLIHFKFILQYLEFSLKQELRECELSIQMKKYGQKQNIATIQIKNPERYLNIYKLPIDQIVELDQKLAYKEGEYVDYNIKFLFYLQGTQLIGDCLINLAYFLNGNVQDFQKIKKPLTSTNDKKAALFFKINLNNSKSSAESQEIPKIDIPSPAEDPRLTQRGRTDSKRDPPMSTRNSQTAIKPPQRFRAKSTSPSKVMKEGPKIQQFQPQEQQQPQEDEVQDNLTMKFQELDNKFAQEKEKNQQVQDDFNEITAIISKQEEELECQLSQIDTQIESLKQQTSETKFRKSYDKFAPQQQDQEYNSSAFKLNDLQESYDRCQEENGHLKRIIRQQSETIRKLSQNQNNYSNNSNNSPIQNNNNNNNNNNQNEEFEKIIEKKNQTIEQLSNQIFEFEKNSNPSVMENLKAQIKRYEQIIDEQQNQMKEQEKIYQQKICRLLKGD